ncbi:hypothetical protein EJ06DRAFT_61742 [Trichodelitschia bisporula]|uniref:Secreted protein n=1 Tax=Trichodelitschia bisporula TaxID=703511 RepID=A0A6G1HUJ5_9PEZI|nr:hypothetical protein EJ06DRAFT_61742 [Trichodelitschia bisporula]
MLRFWLFTTTVRLASAAELIALHKLTGHTPPSSPQQGSPRFLPDGSLTIADASQHLPHPGDRAPSYQTKSVSLPRSKYQSPAPLQTNPRYFLCPALFPFLLSILYCSVSNFFILALLRPGGRPPLPAQ